MAGAAQRPDIQQAPAARRSEDDHDASLSPGHLVRYRSMSDLDPSPDTGGVARADGRYDVDGAEPLPSGTGPWRVFLSHTGELARLPTKAESYVACAAQAVRKAGHTPVDMEDFDLAHVTPTSTDHHNLRSCDVYLGLYGFRWGTASTADPEKSYTEEEYELARGLKMVTSLPRSCISLSWLF